MNSPAPRVVWPAAAELGEGPLWSPREQALYWTDILAGHLHRYTPASDTRRSWSFDENVCAVAERSSGGLILTLRSGFAFFDPESGALTRLHHPEADQPGNRFNDGKCDSVGRFWAGSMDFDCQRPSGALYRFEPDGRCTRMLHGYAVTNGPAFSCDGHTLFHNDTNTGRVLAYDFDAARGELAGERVFAQFDPAQGCPDGMTVDRDGGLWVALFGGGQVVRLDARGLVSLRIPLPCRNVTSCGFGGYDLATLFITTARVGLSVQELAAQPDAGALFAVEIAGVTGDPPAQFGG